MKKKKPRKKTKKAKLTATAADRHILYEAAVQSVDADIDFFIRTFKKRRRRPLRLLREDFCGTAALACEFIGRNEKNHAWGIDLHKPTLDWGMKHHVSRLGTASQRLTLIHDDVLNVNKPKVDLVAALNFSYSVFQSRELLRRYFQRVRDSLNEDGVLVLDAWGGTESMDELEEDRRIPATKAPDGTRISPFIYMWEQESFNIINHHIVCHIHFKFKDKTVMRRAFTYDWRLWTLPELQEIMVEAGFRDPEVYLEGWDDKEDDADGVFRRKRKHDNMAGWVGYVVAYR